MGHGLKNSIPIIPQYYFTTHDFSKLFEIDYYYMILDDISNLRKLNNYQLDYIKTLDSDKKIEIIELMHKTLHTYMDQFRSNPSTPTRDYSMPNLLCIEELEKL